ncbi:MAG: cytochrome b5-like heme/steroid binding domain-containing protein [Monoraphidium minutum]|nr:MAG: cytochrome b5-like heme/steroid binding domain-containing protein [Monoraphidium minutum]
MDGILVGAAVLTAVVIVVVAVRRKQATFSSHVRQLQAGGGGAAPPQRRRTLVVGRWTREEVAMHSAADDLWLIIQDQRSKEWRVYDVTQYVDEHPGGMAIMYNAGGDATKGFHGPQHPPTVFELLADYCVGTLVDP